MEFNEAVVRVHHIIIKSLFFNKQSVSLFFSCLLLKSCSYWLRLYKANRFKAIQQVLLSPIVVALCNSDSNRFLDLDFLLCVL